MGRPLNRIVPNLPAAAYKTYGIRSPMATHFRPATCAEVDCQPYQFGWVTTVPAGSQDEAVIRRAGRRFFEERVGGGFIQFKFPPGQSCFKVSTHRVSLQRPENFVVLGGDWRGNPTGSPAVKHTKPEFWIEDFAGHQDRLKTARERG
jgi:hypothetical protein